MAFVVSPVIMPPFLTVETRGTTQLHATRKRKQYSIPQDSSSAVTLVRLSLETMLSGPSLPTMPSNPQHSISWLHRTQRMWFNLHYVRLTVRVNCSQPSWIVISSNSELHRSKIICTSAASKVQSTWQTTKLKKAIRVQSVRKRQIMNHNDYSRLHRLYIIHTMKHTQ